MTKRIVITLLAMFLAAGFIKAQVVITGDFDKRMAQMHVTVVDSLTNEPVPFVSVYVKAKGDTVITNFTLTDHEGKAEIKKIPYGQYTVTAELMGYRPWTKEIYFRTKEKDFGTVRLQEDAQFLSAATVTDIGTPIAIAGDTLVFNASSFQIGSNDMLGDLLKRMPGMEVAADGSVKMNGEPVSKITVGGKTFFFDDPSTAVRNLPAFIIDKIKVFDKQSKEAEFTGIADSEKNKVMDITVKKEYRNGWFGNLKAMGGTSLDSKDQPDFLETDSHLLYNASALVAGYTERDQLTLVGNAYNSAEDPDAVFVVVSNDGEVASSDGNGLTTAWQGGLNLNTDRLKGMETTFSVNLKGSDKDSRSTSSRTTYRDSQDDLLSNGQSRRLSGARTFNIGLEMEKENEKKFSLEMDPFIRLTRNISDTYSTSSAESAGAVLNSSEAYGYSITDALTLGGSLTAGVKHLGKEKRSVTLSLSPSFTNSDGWSKSFSTTEYSSSTDVRDLFYLSDTKSRGMSGSLAYVEPFGENWALRTRAQSSISARDYTRTAYNRTDAGAWTKGDGDRSSYSSMNDYYSSVSNNDYIRNSASVLIQYNRKPFNIQAGFEGMLTRNETYSKSYGVATETGMDEWLFDWAPSVNARYNRNEGIRSLRVSLTYRGSTSQPSAQRMLPTLDLSNPTRISTGNIYLKPSFTQRLSLQGTSSNTQTTVYWNATASMSRTDRAIVTASWYDSDGVLYSIPLNSNQPRTTFSSYLNGSVPLEKSKRLKASGTFNVSVSSMTSYQNTSTREGLDIDSFDYGAFMEEFWGNANGSRFFSGESGFSRSSTRTVNLTTSGGIDYRGDFLDAGVVGSAVHRTSRYSLDSRTNTSVWDFRISGNIAYTTAKDWEFRSFLGYLFYRGYAEGYGQSELRWDVRVSKSIGAFTFMLNGFDLFNQTRNLTHTVSDNYMEDEYTNLMGRYFLFGVKWNFGKMSSKQSSRATRASMRMMM